MSDFDDPYAERLRRVLDEQARALDPTEPLDDGLARIRARVEQSPSAARRWAVPLAAAAAVLLVVVAGAIAWPRGSNTPVGTGTQNPTPNTSQSLPPSGSPTPSASGTATAGPGINVPVYYGVTFAGRTLLYREFHRTTGDPVTGALQQMLAGPQDTDYRSLWPAATTVTSVTRSGSVATVTLSAAPTATTPSNLPVQEVVYTVTAADPTIRSVTVVYPGGQATTVTRGISYETLASVWVLAPVEGSTVTSPVAISGLAEVFEARVNWEVDRPDGTVVAHGATNATQAAPGRWPWSDKVVLAPGRYLLKVFSISAKDGSVQWPDTKAFTVR